MSDRHLRGSRVIDRDEAREYYIIHNVSPQWRERHNTSLRIHRGWITSHSSRTPKRNVANSGSIQGLGSLCFETSELAFVVRQYDCEHFASNRSSKYSHSIAIVFVNNHRAVIHVYFWLGAMSENRPTSSLICSTFTGILNELSFIILFILTSSHHFLRFFILFTWSTLADLLELNCRRIFV